MECPTWIMKTIITEDKLKICPIICEIPKSDLMTKLHISGQFNQAIVRQMIMIIGQLRGNHPSGSICQVDFKPILEDNYDLILLMFQKKFCFSTQTVVLATKVLDKEIIKKYNNNLITKSLFKKSESNIKLDIRTITNNSLISLAYLGKLKEKEGELKALKSRI